jgi:all-trans-8'-apo-beta-carotenal 15,15'-oxygenase
MGLNGTRGAPTRAPAVRHPRSPQAVLTMSIPVKSSAVHDNAPLLERAFTLDVVEQSAAATDTTGTVPPFLRGTCYFNGPARFSRGGLKYRHWLDGDGMIAALAVGPDGATFTNRFVRSAKFVREEAEGRPVFRTFGTSFEGDELKRGIGLETPVNVSVYPHGDTLLAFGEQGLPWTMDPVTLETRGVCTFDGQLNDITPFSAHPKIDYHTGEFFNFGVSFAPNHPAVNVFRFAADGRLVYRKRLALPYPASIHDFALGARHLVFFVSPLLLDMGALVRGGSTLMGALSWQPERGSHLIVASRETGELLASLEAGQGHCLHLVNAFDRDGLLVADIVEYERPLYDEYEVVPDLFSTVSPGVPTRLLIDVEGGRIVERRRIAYNCSPDFPAHSMDLTGLPYESMWMLGISAAGRPGRKFFDQLVRVDWDAERVELWQAPRGTYLGGEPVFVPEPGDPRNGAVVCQAFDADSRTSSFVVFDAQRLASGPIATVTIPSPIPLLFHSSYWPR